MTGRVGVWTILLLVLSLAVFSAAQPMGPPGETVEAVIEETFQGEYQAPVWAAIAVAAGVFELREESLVARTVEEPFQTTETGERQFPLKFPT